MEKSFLGYFTELKIGRKVKIICKNNSPIMWFVSLIIGVLHKLRLVGITRDDFMTNYVTTLWSRIYTSKLLKQKWETGNSEDTILLHELVHVLQFQESKLMWLKYLLSKKKRAYYESEAEQVSMHLDFAEPQSYPVRLKAGIYAAYGIPSDIMRKELHKRVVEVLHESERENASILIKLYKRWNLWHNV